MRRRLRDRRSSASRQLVARDVRDELMTAEDARRDYGVVLDPATLELDVAATARERAAAAVSRP